MTGAKARIAAVGAGRMGRGLAHVFAYAGHEVALIDLKERSSEDAEKLEEEARGEVEATIQSMTEFGVQTADQGSAALARITFHGAETAPVALANADFVFEGVPEVLNIKRRALGMIGAAEIQRLAKLGHQRFCAKLNHDYAYRCIHCGHEPSQADHVGATTCST